MNLLFEFFGLKCGMTSLFLDDGRVVPSTVVFVPDVYVTGVRTIEKNGYNAVCLASMPVEDRKINNPQLKYLKKIGIDTALKYEFERRVADDFDMSSIEIGKKIENFIESLSGEMLDTRSISKGKGFAGVMKRYNFGGQEASHGHSLSHRSIGSTGNRTDPGKVFKNKRMPGHMGAKMNCIQSVSVLKVDAEKNVIFLKGSVSGFNGAAVLLSNAVKLNKISMSKDFALNGVVIKKKIVG